MLDWIKRQLDRWGGWVGVAFAALLGLVYSANDFFALDEDTKAYFFVVVLVLTILSTLLAFFFEQQRPQINKLQDQIKERQEFIDEVADNIFFLFDGLILNLARKLDLLRDHKSRVSLYVHDPENDQFIPCGRYSANPELKKRGRSKYPDNQGCIAKGWQDGWHFVNDLPRKRSAQQKRLEKDYNIPEKVHNKIRMLSVLVGVIKLTWHGSNPVAVIVVESLDKNAFQGLQLKTELESVSDDYAETISVFHDQLLQSHTSKGVEAWQPN